MPGCWASSVSNLSRASSSSSTTTTRSGATRTAADSVIGRWASVGTERDRHGDVNASGGARHVPNLEQMVLAVQVREALAGTRQADPFAVRRLEAAAIVHHLAPQPVALAPRRDGHRTSARSV